MLKVLQGKSTPHENGFDRERPRALEPKIAAPDKRTDVEKEQDRNAARRIFDLKSCLILKIQGVCGFELNVTTEEPIFIKVRKSADIASVMAETHGLLWGTGLVFQEDYDFKMEAAIEPEESNDPASVLLKVKDLLQGIGLALPDDYDFKKANGKN